LSIGFPNRWIARDASPAGARYCPAALPAMLPGEERGSGSIDLGVTFPGPPMRSAWERQCAGPLCLPARALSSASGGSVWGRRGSRRIGSTTVNVVRCRFGSVRAVTTAIFIVPAVVHRSVGASRNVGPKHATKRVAEVLRGMPPGNGGGGGVDEKNKK
jgi:hypothetical protein